MSQADRVDQIAEAFWQEHRSGAYKKRGLTSQEFLLETLAGYMVEQVVEHQDEHKEDAAMSKDWNQQELEAASAEMVAQGHMGYDEFCEKVMPVIEGSRLRAAFHLKGAERKPLVLAVSAITGAPSKYRGMPSCVYEVGSFRIGKDGELTAVPGTDSGAFERVLEQLALKGFEAAVAAGDKPTEAPVEPESPPVPTVEPPLEPAPLPMPPEDALESSTVEPVAPIAMPTDEPGWPGPVIQVPMDGFTESKLTNLRKLIDSKYNLIQKALGATDLIFSECDGALCFPWFDRELDAFEIQTYTHFIAALCDTAKRQQRVVATEKDVPSERFTFRIFLLKLGFAGAEYKGERALLYRNLSGDCAFNSADKRDAHADKWKGIRQERRAAGNLSNQAASEAAVESEPEPQPEPDDVAAETTAPDELPA